MTRQAKPYHRDVITQIESLASTFAESFGNGPTVFEHDLFLNVGGPQETLQIVRDDEGSVIEVHLDRSPLLSTGEQQFMNSMLDTGVHTISSDFDDTQKSVHALVESGWLYDSESTEKKLAPHARVAIYLAAISDDIAPME